MTLHKFLSRLNWRQILIHFVATWFFMHSFLILAFLLDTKLLDIIIQADNQNKLMAFDNNGTSTSDLMRYIFYPFYGRTIGLLIAFLISLKISNYKNWFWANSVVVLIVAYLLGWYHLLGWVFLKNIFLTPGEIFKNTVLMFLTNGLILLTIGLLTFLLARTNRFIELRNRG